MTKGQQAAFDRRMKDAKRQGKIRAAAPEMYEAIMEVLNDDAAFTIIDMVYLRRVFEPILSKLDK